MSRRLPLLLTLSFLIWGSWLRLGALGHAPFATDEAIQYFASRGVEQHGAPVLPSGTAYHRGIDYSRMAAAALRHVHPPERAARLPAALLGTLDLVLLTLIAWGLEGAWAAAWTAAIAGIYPETVHLSRYARFYTLQLAFGLAALYAAWRTLRNPVPAPPAPAAPSLRRQWAWLLAALLAFALAAREQIVTLSTAAGLCALLAVFGLADWRRLGRSAWRRSVPLQTAAMGLVAAAIIAAAKPGLFGYLFWRAGAVPLWAELSSPGGGPVTAYYRGLSQHFPLAISLLPLTWLVLLVAVLASGSSSASGSGCLSCCTVSSSRGKPSDTSCSPCRPSCSPRRSRPPGHPWHYTVSVSAPWAAKPWSRARPSPSSGACRLDDTAGLQQHAPGGACRAGGGLARQCGPAAAG